MTTLSQRLQRIVDAANPPLSDLDIQRRGGPTRSTTYKIRMGVEPNPKRPTLKLLALAIPCRLRYLELGEEPPQATPGLAIKDALIEHKWDQNIDGFLRYLGQVYDMAISRPRFEEILADKATLQGDEALNLSAALGLDIASLAAQAPPSATLYEKTRLSRAIQLVESILRPGSDSNLLIDAYLNVYDLLREDISPAQTIEKTANILRPFLTTIK